MGWNTGVIILNDALGQIEDHPEEFVQNLRQAIGEYLRYGGKSVDIAVGGHVNAAAVFHQSHADNTGVYAIGGNHATRLLETYNGGRHHSDEDKVALLKQLAEEMGYNISKKPVKGEKKGQGITPGQVVDAKENQIPDEVFAAFDELIAKDFNQGYATVMQNEVLLLALKKLKAAGHRRMTRQIIFDNHWLDVEAIYRKRGWAVEYDKPAYNETYEANFKFKKKKS